MNMTSLDEIPVWVNGVEKWVTGVTRRTTCGDLVRALLSAEHCSAPDETELRQYALVERWRQVERPLDPSARIQKVWRTWGDDTAEVSFTLKRLGLSSARESAQRRRKRHSRAKWRSSTTSLEAMHPRKLAATSAAGGGAPSQDVVECLMQTILAQGETIAAQLKRLHARQDLIGYYEHKMHRMREDRMGPDYLLKTYLQDSGDKDNRIGSADKTSHDSGVGAELADGMADLSFNRDTMVCDGRSYFASAAPDGTVQPELRCEEETVTELRQTLLYLERLVDLNSRIVEHEELAARLEQRLRRAAEEDGDDTDAESAESQAVLELEISRAELERLLTLCARQEAQIEQNERALVECERALEHKRQFVRFLEIELSEAEVDEQNLLANQQRLFLEEQRVQEAEKRLLENHQRLLVRDQRVPITQYRPKPLVGPPGDIMELPVSYANPVYTDTPARRECAGKEVAGGDGDSNSDTGLSSLHSSSDEAAVGYVLDTLV